MIPTHLHQIIENTKVGKDCSIWYFVNIYNANIGDEVSIGSYTEVNGSKIGYRTRVGPYVFIPEGITIGDYCFIGPRVTFTNDKTPNAEKSFSKQFTPLETIIEDNVVIGANVTILPGLNVGKYAVIGAGSVVTKDVPAYEVWCGNPAKKLK